MITPIKGTHDVLDVTLYNFILGQARIHFNSVCFTEIATPILEPLELFKRSLGTHTDVVSKEMFIIQPHVNSNEQICLRPEATASTTRAFIQHGIQEQPWKVFSHGPMFRYERPQKGRLREFHQLNIEIIDTFTIAHDIQLLNLLNRFFRERMRLNNFTLFINFLGCPSDRIAYRELLQEFLARHTLDLCETCVVRAETNSLRVFDCKISSCQELYTKAPVIADNLCSCCAREWFLLKEQLLFLSVPYSYNPKLVRGLDYYNKTVFEFSSTDLGAQNAFCGGGRYELASQCGAKKPVPSIGAAVGIERLILLLEPIKEALSVPQKPIIHVIMPLSEAQQSLALRYVNLLHSNGLCVEALLEGGSVKHMMRKANKIGAMYTLLLGETEQQNKTVTIKNMISGEQVTVDQDQVVDYLTRLKK